MAPALVITTLGALESLLSASAADGMSGTKHHPNSELIGIGIGNILTGLAGGIPATGAIARTSTNILSGAKTPLASSIHGIFIMLYVLLLAPYMSYIPMASLAALLITVAYRMSHWQQFIRIVMIAPRSDTIVLITCFAFTIFIDMVAGVTAGVVLACLLLIKRMTNLTRSEISHVSTSYHSKISHLKLPQDMMIYHITGPVFFGTMEIVFDRIRFIQDQIKTIIIDMENVPFIDITGLVAMKNIIMDTQNNNISIILCGKGEITDKIIQKLTFSSKNKVRVFETMEQVVKVIENYVKSYE
jgi:SulP family sulfate permease